MKSIFAFAAGLVFGLGLVVSQMVNPAKVQNFLDFADIFDGTWDGSLMFVMGGALITLSIARRFILAQGSPVCDTQFHEPKNSFSVTGKLVAGSALFGIGWGLGGFCPGPALTSVASLAPGVLIFVLAMIVGMFATKYLVKG